MLFVECRRPEREVLEPVVVNRLQSDGPELRANVFGRDVESAHAGFASFEDVAGEKVDGGGDGRGSRESGVGGRSSCRSLSGPRRPTPDSRKQSCNDE